MANSERSNNLIHAVFESRKLPKARSHNDLRDSLIALGDRDRSRKRQLAKLHAEGVSCVVEAKAVRDQGRQLRGHLGDRP